MPSYDIIGDIHGHADELVQLLQKLGLSKDDNGVFRYQCIDELGQQGQLERKVIFVGDLVDRGPAIRQTLEIVKKMVDNGVALCLRGNHEDNAVRFWKTRTDGRPGYLRSHSVKNIIQHMATIKSFQNREEELDSYLKWFETLPYYLDLPELRVAHACWPSNLVDKLSKTEEQPINLEASVNYDEDLKSMLLRGEEIELPKGMVYKDKDGNARTHVRTKWWLNPRGLSYKEYCEAFATEIEGLDKVMIDDKVLPTLGTGYKADEKPIFFGHYWLRGEPELQAPNVCCLDYSVAKGGSLVAYRFDGEQTLDKNKLVYVDAIKGESSKPINH